jgi:uncharacterized protein (TIGR02246 family)
MKMIRRLSVVLLIAVASGSSGPRTSGRDAGLAASAQAWQRAINSGDVNGLVSYFDDDATAFYPRSQPSLGKEEIRRDWAEFFSQKNASHPVTTENVITAASGDLGYVIGSAQGSWTDSEGNHSFSGKILTVWQKKNGPWRIVAQSGNVYDNPAK